MLYPRQVGSLELSHRQQEGKILNPPVGMHPHKTSPARPPSCVWWRPTDNYKDGLCSPWGTSAGSVRPLCLLIFQQPYSLKPPGTSQATLPCHLICGLHHCPPTACPEVGGPLHFGMAYLHTLQHFTLAYFAGRPSQAAVTALSTAQAVMALLASQLLMSV